MRLHDLLTQYADLQRRRQQEADAIESGQHGSYELYDELEDDIAALLIDHAPELTSLLARLDALADAVTAYSTAADAGESDDGHDEAIRVAAREVVEQERGTGGEKAGTDYGDLRQAHTQALRAADGDSNDAEIAAWRETAELATAYLPGYEEPSID